VTAVLVTRPGGEGDPLVGALEASGYRVHAVPTVGIQPLDFDRPDLAAYDWVVVTSAAGVAALTTFPPGPRWAAVGTATARALRAVGVEPALVPDEADGLALANALPDVNGRRVLLVRASSAASDLPERLLELGAAVEELTAYLTIEGPPSSAAAFRAALRDADLAAVVFASGSAVRGFLALGGTAAVPAITIGPRTTEVARHLGFRVIAEADKPSAEALAAAVADAIPVEERHRA
jgi:uroporphyrinogen-III synthase